MGRFLSPRRPSHWVMFAVVGLLVWTPPANPHPFLLHPAMHSGGGHPALMHPAMVHQGMMHPAMMHPAMGHPGALGIHPALLQHHQQMVAHQLALIHVHLQARLHAEHAHLLAMHHAQQAHTASQFHGMAPRSHAETTPGLHTVARDMGHLGHQGTGSHTTARDAGHSGHQALARVVVDLALLGRHSNHHEGHGNQQPDAVARNHHQDHRTGGHDQGQHDKAAPSATAAHGSASVDVTVKLLQGQPSGAGAGMGGTAFPLFLEELLGEELLGAFELLLAFEMGSLAFPEVFPGQTAGAAALLLGEGTGLTAEVSAFPPPP